MPNLEFNNLLISNADFLKPFAVNLTKDTESAKDLFQETLYKALANQEKYNVGTNIKAWLFTIMRNIFINDYRRKTKQQTIFDSTPKYSGSPFCYILKDTDIMKLPKLYRSHWGQLKVEFILPVNC
jgi:RNA polymerase sigma factor (sigma-70 family)